jgi:peptidoglycan/LPS O-acetylase OafA/YrhL
MGRSSLFAFALALAASLTIEYLNVLPQTTGDMAVGAATAGMLSCRAVRSLRLARLHGRLAGFSYSLYVVHFPIATALIGAWQQLAHVQHRSTPGPVAFLVFSATLLGCYLAAFAIAQFTERRAGDFRRALSGILIGLHLPEPSSLVAHSGRLSAVVTRPLRGNTPRGDRFRGLRNLLAIDPLASGGLERARRAQHSGRQSIPGHYRISPFHLAF